MWLTEADKYTNRNRTMLASLAVSMGGRVEEEIIFGDSPTARARSSRRTAIGGAWLRMGA